MSMVLFGDSFDLWDDDAKRLLLPVGIHAIDLWLYGHAKHDIETTLIDMKCVPVRLSGNYFIAKTKLVKILDPLLMCTPAISGFVI